MKLIIVSQIDACPTPDLPSSFARTQLEFDRSMETGVNDRSDVIIAIKKIHGRHVIKV